MICDLENSIYVQRNMLILDQRIEEEIKLLHLLTRYGAKFSNFSYFLYDLTSLKEFERLERVQSELNPFEDPTLKLKRHTDKIIPIRTHLRLLGFVYKLNLPTMILNLAQKHSSQSNVDLINRSDSRKSDRSSDATQTSSTISQLTDLEMNANDVSVVRMKSQLIGNLNSLIEFIQRTVIDSFEKQFYFEQIQSLYELLARF